MQDCSFMISQHLPETFELPYQYEELLDRMDEEDRRNPIVKESTAPPQQPPIWILKPTLGARGEGIELLWKTDQVPVDSFIV